jgi:hypothetical protein
MRQTANGSVKVEGKGKTAEDRRQPFRSRRLSLFYLLPFALCLLPLTNAIATPIFAELAQTRSSNRCPEELGELVPLMLRDLPSYANRVNQRSRVRTRTEVSSNYILIAGNPEYEPLTLGPGRYEPTTTDEDDPKQVFFTTLERQYSHNGVVQMQNYHWLFLTETQQGWQVVLMFSRFGRYEFINQPPSPPEDTSQGIIAQAIRIWLRDCQAGEIINSM